MKPLSGAEFAGRLPAPARPAALISSPRSSLAFGSGHRARSGSQCSTNPASLRAASSPILQFLNWGFQQLELAEVLRPRWTAEQLLSHRLGCRPVQLYLEPPPLSDEQAIRFRADVAARAHGMPLQYLIGSTEFYGREFLVGPGVFIPRPETEVLIDTVLKMERQRGGFAGIGGRAGTDLVSGPLHSLRETRERGRRFERPASPGPAAYGEASPLPLPLIVDVGTGSGAIAVTLAMECPGAQVQAIDKSPTALSFARRNAERHGCEISFMEGDLLAAVAPNSADLIVANLPYLNPADAPTWSRELHWEPWLALDGGQEGLSLIQKLMRQAASVLKQDGKLLLEIGAGQSRQIQQDAGASGFRADQIILDLAGLERVMVLWKN